jgi:glutamate/tyrosine decarboxylase-like PLP-dependent enzyme
MRRLGYAVVDRIVDHVAGVRDEPPIQVGDAAALLAALGGPAPEAPGDATEAFATLFDEVLTWRQRGDHPRFFARIGSPSNYVSALADAVASGFNVFAGSWTGGSGPVAVEIVVLDWLRELCGLPAGTEGVLTSGGSAATLNGLAAARAARLDAATAPAAVTYLSSEAHASNARALRVLGFSGEQVRVLTATPDQRLDPGAVEAAVREDLTAGRRPFCVIASAGTTSTGSVDPLRALAALCAEHGLWLHVDGAYGAPAALCAAGREVLDGLELADSLVLDPHKWLFQPYEIGCVLVREPGALERAFTLDPGPYLRDTVGGEVDFRHRGLQLSRGGRALKLWLSIRVFGLAAFREAIEHGIALAEHAEARLRERPGWEVASPAQLGIVCFRRDGDDALQDRIAAATVAAGSAAPSTTVVGGRVVLRLCTLNPRTTFADVDATLDAMESASDS